MAPSQVSGGKNKRRSIELRRLELTTSRKCCNRRGWMLAQRVRRRTFPLRTKAKKKKNPIGQNFPEFFQKCEKGVDKYSRNLKNAYNKRSAKSAKSPEIFRKMRQIHSFRAFRLHAGRTFESIGSRGVFSLFGLSTFRFM